LKKASKNYKKLFWLIILSWFFLLMLNITLRYIPYKTDVAFLAIKQTEVSKVPFYLFFFYLHVYTSIFALLAGFTQFNNQILAKNKSIHRIIGKIYIIVVLLFASPSGFFIGLHANGGITSVFAFTILAILWFYFTLKAYISIKENNILAHKQFMYRSYALAFSAVTLRLWKVILVFLFQPSPMDVYQIIAWLGWIPNLLFVEFILLKKLKR
jgi:uncharacterized membrane protein